MCAVVDRLQMHVTTDVSRQLEEPGCLAKLEQAVEMVCVFVRLGKTDLASADVEWRELAVTCRFYLDESVTPADFVRTNVVPSVVPHGFGDLLDVSGEAVLALAQQTCALELQNQCFSRISERSIERFHLKIIDRGTRLGGDDVFNGSLTYRARSWHRRFDTDTEHIVDGETVLECIDIGYDHVLDRRKVLAHHIPQHALEVDKRFVPVDIRESQLDQDRADVLVFALNSAMRAAIQSGL